MDPAKFDFYAMDCYRLVGEDRLASTLASEVLREGMDFDGTERKPMRSAEARVTAARGGDLEQALIMGERALAGDRQSVPSLIMTSRELAAEMKRSCRARAPSGGWSSPEPRFHVETGLSARQLLDARHMVSRHLGC
ncbi:hypothetical protein [Streptomyces sp. H27-C3]|uniref:hypothetical protein n=1 Tax=Streptomyces sp. H27-C3 TaxID=3046305 RepID=UPI0024BA32BF|nr:hypothetical protein [Streptomyces sp. H27-C3]MDJ0466310.1 hypothetical protein [Streptomyces sp. H27-C3]